MRRPVTLSLTVSLDDELVQIEIDQGRRVADLIAHALSSFGLEEQDPGECHLATLDRLYMPDAPLTSSGLESGITLYLRLPL